MKYIIKNKNTEENLAEFEYKSDAYIWCWKKNLILYAGWLGILLDKSIELVEI